MDKAGGNFVAVRYVFLIKVRMFAEPSVAAYLQQFAELPPEELEKLQGLADSNVFGKSCHLIELQSSCRHVHFVQSGLARHYYYDIHGNEVTTWFSETGSLITDFAAFTTGRPTSFQVEALSELHTLSLTQQALQHLFDHSKQWERIGRLLNQHYLIMLIERSNSMAVKSARQRYEAFCESSPHLFNEVPLKHIASFLGITLETLSRLRGDKYDG